MPTYHMEQTMHWSGPSDPVTLSDIRQAGCTRIVTALHQIPPGAIWPLEAIVQRRQLIVDAGMQWQVADALPVSEDIKRQSGNYREHIANYKETLHYLAICGIQVITYNFTPLLHQFRTNVSSPLYFEKAAFIAFDLFLLQRPEAAKDYTDIQINTAKKRFQKMTTAEKQALTKAALSGSPEQGTLSQLSAAMRTYVDIDAATLTLHLYDFLHEIIPIAETLGLKLAILPDECPFSIPGLPCIMRTAADLTGMLNAIPSPANGICFCSSIHPAAMLERLGPYIHFLHLRNIHHDAAGNLHEADQLFGDADMYAIVSTIVQLMQQRQCSIPMRTGHTRQSLIGRVKSMAELRGLEMGINKGK